MYLKSTVQVLPYEGKTLIWDRKRDRKIVIHLHFEEFYNQLGKDFSDVLEELLITNQFITHENDKVDLDIYEDVPSYFYIAKYPDYQAITALLKREGMIRILHTMDNYILMSPILFSKDDVIKYIVRIVSSSRFYRSYLDVLKNREVYKNLLDESIFKSEQYRKILIDFIKEASLKEDMAGKIDIRDNKISFVKYLNLPSVKEKVREEWKWLFLM